jgi:hypothetical protein
MSKLMTWCTGVAVLGVLAGCGQLAAPQPQPQSQPRSRSRSQPRAAAGSRGRVIEVPGLGALSRGKHGYSRVNALSCPSAGNCAAGGHYEGGRGATQQGFVAVERNGRWRTATGVPGLAALNKGRFASVVSVSCSSARSCTAGGYYGDADLHDSRGFVAAEKNGTWRKAVTFPADDGSVDSLFCTSAGNCAAGGSYTGKVAQQGFVVVERHGVWGTATTVPGLAALNTGGNAQVNGVSCASAGNCVAGGYYENHLGLRGFASVERNGRWGQATAVPGLAALAKRGGQTQVLAVSCARAGRCALGGSYIDRSGHRQGFVDTWRNGVWGTPVPVPGLPALNQGGSAGVGALSCPRPGTCAAGGFYTSRTGHIQGWVTQGQIPPLRP